MMLYCSKCRVVTDKEACPSCGRKKLRAPEPDDAVLLTAGDVRALEAVFDLLKAKGILSDLYADAKGRRYMWPTGTLNGPRKLQKNRGLLGMLRNSLQSLSQ